MSLLSRFELKTPSAKTAAAEIKTDATTNFLTIKFFFKIILQRRDNPQNERDKISSRN
jgi:hypothetical protein